MKPMTNAQSIINFRLLSFLFALTIVLHIVASTISISHPLFSACLTLGESVGWLSISLLWLFMLVRGVQQWGPKIWSKAWTSVRRQFQAQKAKSQGTSISAKQLAALRTDVQRLGLALHGMTPQMENARQAYFQTVGEAPAAHDKSPQSVCVPRRNDAPFPAPAH